MDGIRPGPGKLDELVERLKARRAGGGSSLYRFMRDGHGRLRELLGPGRPSWREVALDFAAVGVTSRSGRPITGERLRRVWERVCRDLSRFGADGARGKAGSASAPAFGGARESAIYPWLYEHFDEMVATVGAGRMDWVGLCRRLAALGIRESDGTPVNRDTARMAWKRVRDQMRSERLSWIERSAAAKSEPGADDVR